MNFAKAALLSTRVTRQTCHRPQQASRGTRSSCTKPYLLDGGAAFARGTGEEAAAAGCGLTVCSATQSSGPGSGQARRCAPHRAGGEKRTGTAVPLVPLVPLVLPLALRWGTTFMSDGNPDEPDTCRHELDKKERRPEAAPDRCTCTRAHSAHARGAGPRDWRHRSRSPPIRMLHTVMGVRTHPRWSGSGTAQDSRTAPPWSAGRACGARQRVHRIREHRRQRWCCAPSVSPLG
jgi:hypothetical protein